MQPPVGLGAVVGSTGMDGGPLSPESTGLVFGGNKLPPFVGLGGVVGSVGGSVAPLSNGGGVLAPE